MERLATRATVDRALRALQVPKYPRTKRQSTKDVLGEVKMNLARLGLSADIDGSSDPFSVHTSAQLRIASMRFVNTSDFEPSSHVRQTTHAISDDPDHFSGC